MTYIFVIGDSIAYGAWDFEKQGWVQRLREFLDKKVEENPKDNFFLSLARSPVQCKKGKWIGKGRTLAKKAWIFPL